MERSEYRKQRYNARPLDAGIVREQQEQPTQRPADWSDGSCVGIRTTSMPNQDILIQTPETATTPHASAFAPFLSVLSVSKGFGDHQVLRNLDLNAYEGEMVAIVGKSGCGKSTLLRLLAGLERPTEGTIAVESSPINGRNRAGRLMFQDAALLPWETALDNVALANPNRNGRRELARKALRQVGLAYRARIGLQSYPEGRDNE
jgi:ABC-type transport system involved in cytochrome bd biosynthesis fused ATPase/permease subunit